jgi:hypothetical protein
MVSAATNTNNTSAIDALAAQARGTSSSTAASSTTTPASDAKPTDPSRGPAVLITLSLQLSPGPSDDVAQTLADQAKKTTDALATLDQNDKSKAEQDKAEAREKLDLARKKLQTLQIMGGDPESLAQQAKAIGKEIKDAATEYTNALKVEMGGNTAAAPAEAAPADNAAADSATAAATATGATATPPDGSAPSPAAATAGDPAAPAVPAATPQTTVQAYQSAADRAAANARFDPVEENVLASFKGAAQDLKAIMEQASRQLKAKDPTAAHGGSNSEAEMDKAIQELTDTIRIKEGGGDTDISVGSVAPAAAAPTLDIQA